MYRQDVYELKKAGIMKNILIINTHQPYPSSGGALNAALTELDRGQLESLGHEVQVAKVADGYDKQD